MRVYKEYKGLMEKIYKAKEERSKYMAVLPFEEKLKILSRMQELAGLFRKGKKCPKCGRLMREVK